MRIAIFAQNTATDFSGGRYHSVMMAEALAIAGHDIFYITNNRPVFYDDFSMYPHHRDINLCITKDFSSNLPKGDFDVVFLIPSLDKVPFFYNKVLDFTKVRRGRLAFLNFETPNWFSSLYPLKRDLSSWDNWKVCSVYASLILSSAKESDAFAKLFFDNCPPETLFEYCYPSINCILADSVNVEEKKKRIILITRFGVSHHKGGFDAVNLICEAMRGYTMLIIVGAGVVPPKVIDEFKRKGSEHGVSIEFKYKISEIEKFKEIKSASLMLFPSMFEGFGLPPVEAEYCNTPCICFDLPVLREVSGDGLIYVEPGNWAGFREKIGEVLSSSRTYDHLKEHISGVATIESYAERIDKIVENLVRKPRPKTGPFPTLDTLNPVIPMQRTHAYHHVEEDYNGIGHFLLMRVVRPPVWLVLKCLFPNMPGYNIKREFFDMISGKGKKE